MTRWRREPSSATSSSGRTSEEESTPGWLIFKSGPSELGVHPTHQVYEGVTYDYPRHHSISLMCDDLEATKAELESKGAEFAGPIEDKGFGRTVMLKVPGADDIMLYEPRHPLALQPLADQPLTASGAAATLANTCSLKEAHRC